MTASSHKIISKRKRFKMVKLPISTFLVATLALIGFIVISFDQFSRQILREVNTNKALRRQLSNSSNNENLNDAERPLELVKKHWSASENDLNDDKEPGKIGLIHLGKCGGTNLKGTLDAHQNSQIMKLRPYTFHLEPVRKKLRLGKYHIWIALIRDPIDRIMSSWVFEHVKNQPYKKDPRPHDFKDDLFECYDTFNDLLINGITNRSSRPVSIENNITCPTLAKDIFNEAPNHGYGMYHFQYNFRRALGPLLEVATNKKFELAKDDRIFVIRAEYMLKDLNDVEAAIGGRNDTFESINKDDHFHVPSAELPRNERTISDAAMEILCNVMCDEIQIYKGLLKAAENLSDSKYFVMINKLNRTCPKETGLDKCPEDYFWLLKKKEQVALYDRYFDKYNLPYLGLRLPAKDYCIDCRIIRPRNRHHYRDPCCENTTGINESPAVEEE